MMAKLKTWLFGALAGLAGLFWIIAQRREAQRDKARRERDVARSAKEAMDAADEAGKRVEKASNERIKQNNEARAKRQSQPADQRFTGRVDTSRLRDPD